MKATTILHLSDVHRVVRELLTSVASEGLLDGQGRTTLSIALGHPLGIEHANCSLRAIGTGSVWMLVEL